MAKWLPKNMFIRALIFLALILSMAGCKLRITVPEGGRVVSESGAITCESGQTCDIDVVDIFFDETFRAVPLEGYYFRRWESGHRLFCGDSYSKECRLITSAFDGNAALASILESDEVFHLQPRFAEGQCELNTVNDFDAEGKKVREEGQKCTVQGIPKPVYQGLVEVYTNNVLVTVAGWDQGQPYGKHVEYNYSWLTEWAWLYDWGREIISYTVKNGQFNGRLKRRYQNGDWWMVNLVDGIQHAGLEEWGIRNPSDRNAAYRFIYTWEDGVVVNGVLYLGSFNPKTGKYSEELSQTWDCTSDEFQHGRSCYSKQWELTDGGP